MEVTKILNGDEYVAVVYSPGFGAGWSTWGAARADDGRIVQWLLDRYHYDTPEEILAEFSEAPTDVIGRFAYELKQMLRLRRLKGLRSLSGQSRTNSALMKRMQKERGSYL